MENFSIYELTSVTNDDVIVTFTPSSETVKYTYRIYRNEQLIDIVKVDSNNPSTITLKESGKLQIKVKGYDSFDNEIEYESGLYLIDKEAPILYVGDEVLSLHLGERLDVDAGVKATDNFDGDVTNLVTSNINDLNLTKTGKHKLIYTVSDSAGNIASKTVIINVAKKDATSLLLFQIPLITVLIFLIILITKYRKSLLLEKRYGKYTIESLEDKSISLVGKVVNFYKMVISKLTKIFKKSVFLKRYANRLNKYLLFTKDTYESSMDIISAKFIMAFIFLIVAIISKTVQYQLLSFYEMCFPFILGFFTLDIVYAIKYRFYHERIENDLLQAIIIMNNAFKSGRSIVQAVDLVGNEMNGVIGDQFKKMKKELSNGLTIEEVFRRFASRIDYEEVTYLTASLSILNKTGGNIIKVFSSIERSLFLKKRLKLELRSLTGSSKIIMWVLFCVPLLFVIAISLLSPGYFVPFFASTFGIILFTIMVILYITYILIVRHILKVRM